MRSKLLVVTAVLLLASCGYKEKPQTDHSEDNIIGQNLSGVSSVNSESGTDQNKVAMYDSTVCRIHQFNLSTHHWERALKPRVLGGNHKVMYDPSGDYVIDVVDANLTIFNKDGLAQDPGVVFAGTPKSASFRPSLGYMVLQDDSKTAAMVKIGVNGNVTGTTTLGQVVYNDVSLLAGDIDDDGKLIVSLTDGKIGIIDIAQTINTGTWTVADSFASGLSTTIDWIAPMHDGSHQILVKTREDSNGDKRLAIFDTNAKVMVGAPYVVPKSRLVIKTSKLYDPHFIVRDDVRTNDPAVSTIIYVQGGTIRTKTITNPMRNILASRISVTQNTWSIVDTDIYKVWDVIRLKWYDRVVFDDYNIVKTNRLFQRFTLGSMGLQKRYVVPDTTEIQIGESKIFQLYPSRSGVAKSNSIMNPSEQYIPERFNLPYTHEKTCQ